MYYDMQSDRLYDNEYAMEGIFGKLKDDIQRRKEDKENKRHEKEEASKIRNEKIREQLKKALPIIKKYINKAKSNPKWKSLPFGDMHIYNDGYLYFDVFKDPTVIIDIDKDDNFIQEAANCFEYIYESIKKEVESNIEGLKVTIYESNEICIEAELSF